ncbi:sporulation inhibitor of replication protein SirA [Sporosarcina thermotolerans]|uniref:Sporulation inhibitor of replication protein SirA n=1 Tax=Sporosarcina thermotolerans TaxID=633404 RepID=A0AAW9A8Y8_9BACL|nr:sporulation inhibitor of replication protein SirA [Sporosarcina thermotolerans]MDW0115646.1 sporulation inhibitor of replication protein SirA [Sporosarcina thermotolerans]WHT47065.1 sporulation inhibitor of replication protein SirA [Sporosarcina thermotolerans]
MRTYDIYKVKKRYQSFILGREGLLYNLLKDYEQQQPLQEVKYLCDEIEESTIDQAILGNLGKSFTKVESDDGEYKLSHPMKGSIHISLTPYSLQAYCDGSRMLDLDLFVALSGSDDRFFAVMDERGEWGWLKPIKQDNRLMTEGTILF